MSAPAAMVVLCTVPAAVGPGQRTAEDLARQLVEDGVAACVNVLPGVRSWFRWQGAVDVAEEQLLVIKCPAAGVPALQARIVALHPYQVPEVLALPVAAGLPAYLHWLTEAVRGPGG